MRDYGGTITCPNCGQSYTVTPRQLQYDLRIEFICGRCGEHTLLDNEIAIRIADHFDGIRRNLSKLRLRPWGGRRET